MVALFQNLDKLNSFNLPEVVTKEHYEAVKECYLTESHRYPDWYIGAIGFLSSYCAKFFDGGYSGSYTKRNYYDERKRNLFKQIPSLQGIKFNYGDYEDLYSPDSYNNCLFYCDIPYESVTKYDTSKNFDYNRFWNWANKMSKNNIVLVSEYTAPDNWQCIWQKELLKTLDYKKNVNSVEKLFQIVE